MFTTVHKTLTDDTETTLFTVPSGYVANIYYIFVANHGGNTRDITLKWENSSGVDQLYFFDEANVSSKDIKTLGGQSSVPLFVIQEEEVIKTQAGHSSVEFEVAMTIDLAPRTPGFNSFD